MNDYIGRWRITEMEMWDQDYVDLIEPGFFEFDDEGLGSFVFGAMQGDLDVRVEFDKRILEFSWQGDCEGDEQCGRGWFRFRTKKKGEGRIFIHRGDDSGVKIERET